MGDGERWEKEEWNDSSIPGPWLPFFLYSSFSMLKIHLSFFFLKKKKKVVLFERATFLVISHSVGSSARARDPHRFEKISNIIKQFKLSCRFAWSLCSYHHHRILSFFLVGVDYNKYIPVVTHSHGIPISSLVCFNICATANLPHSFRAWRCATTSLPLSSITLRPTLMSWWSCLIPPSVSPSVLSCFPFSFPLEQPVLSISKCVFV